ncbi:predicted protein [Sclerotinia sclerotiorum 1980 UF-70]|uniref:Uncharacterized protein n=1 Tax=Sclerotinia sclerotiorum (strain ATCC 18683 / 1980 / Ss-1) TaxID=665079 RepID=A7E882_SCLS1|nr:predicted protein [Sclerotinia sclerotiorum 1980 UF-70]EDN96584.1 predicted protein [Sclerotinia sclerotiorum 1980 UF-70]
MVPDGGPVSSYSGPMKNEMLDRYLNIRAAQRKELTSGVLSATQQTQKVVKSDSTWQNVKESCCSLIDLEEDSDTVPLSGSQLTQGSEKAKQILKNTVGFPF